MELSMRINRHFLWLSALAWVVSSLFFYFFISFVLMNQSKADLKQQAIGIEKIVSRNPDWGGVPPYIRVIKNNNGINTKKNIFRKTLADSTNSSGPINRPVLQFQKSLELGGQSYILHISKSIYAQNLTKWILSILFSIVTILIILLLNYLNKRFLIKTLKPLQESLEQVKQFSNQNPEKPKFAESKVTEFKSLNQEFDVMMDRIRQDYIDLKEFTESAAHELQTPLAIIRKKIESLLEDNNMTTDQSLKLVSIYEQVNRISILNANLLILTKIENGKVGDAVAVDAKEVLTELWEEHSALIESKKFTVQQDIHSCQLDCTKEVLFIALKNLLENAIKYTVEGGKIAVYLTQKSFILGNSGDSALANPQVLYGHAIKGQDWATATGLGLAIVKQIADIYNWKLNYRFEKNMHLFELVFQKG